MKKPEEIKLGLECCTPGDFQDCCICPYKPLRACADVRIEDALVYIQQLERERDALRADLEAVCEVVNTCLACGHYRTDWQKPGCELNDLTCKWSWRGVPEE